MLSIPAIPERIVSKGPETAALIHRNHKHKYRILPRQTF